MSAPETVKAALQAAIASANEATGQNDATVTAAIASLIAGFGSGGAAGGAAGGSWVQAEDANSAEVYHGLGVTPRIFLCWLDMPYEAFPLDVGVCAVWLVLNIGEGVFTIPQQYTSTVSRPDDLYVLIGGIAANGSGLNITRTTSMVYGITNNSSGEVFNETLVKLTYTGSQHKLRAGHTYKWLAVA